MPLTSRKELENARKFPWQWAVYVLCICVGFLFRQYQARNAKSDETCDERVSKLSVVLTRKDSIIFDWQSRYINLSNELLYKNNIIDRQQQVIFKTDSLTRTRLEKPAKQIVKAHE